MAGAFTLIRTPKILFGPGTIHRLPGMINNRGGALLIITGSKSFRQNNEITSLLASFKKNGMSIHSESIEKEPTPEMIDRITGNYGNIPIQAVMAIGGGSVIDAGKAVSGMLPLGAPVYDYLEGVGTKAHPGIKVFFAAVPTTAGTGSEATANAVISGSDARGGFKRSLRHENLIPDLAIVDPALTINCPPHITAASGMDAFTQLIESYLSVKSGPVTDTLALDGIRHVRLNLYKAYKNGEDAEARSGMAYAALLSGITLANAGLGLIHGFASSIGGAFDIPHGVICASLLGTVNRFNIRATLQDKSKPVIMKKYVNLGRLLSDVDGKKDDWYVQFAANYPDELTGSLNISRLGPYGMTIPDLDKIASGTDHKYNPVHFEKAQLIEMLKERL